MAFKPSPIKDRVMKAINAHIANVEKEYVEECDQIDREAFDKKATLADEKVKNLLGKII